MFSTKTVAHDQDVHKYIVWNAWQIVKNQRQGSEYSAMDLRIGNWWQGIYNTSTSWYKGYVISGAWLEDEEDVVYNYDYPYTTSTHFWDPTDNRCGYSGEDITRIDVGICAENAFQKTIAYWYGKEGGNQDWLGLHRGINTGGGLQAGFYDIFLRYSNLDRVYKYNEIYIWAYRRSGTFFTTFPNPPIPLTNVNIQNGTRNLIETICWEILGRMCHLLGDQSVPAHSHNDPHACGVPWMGCDGYEQFYMAPPYNHFLDKDYNSAIQQSINFGGNPIVTYHTANQDPFRFLLYTTNQLADRFPSNDEDGDAYYSFYGPNNEPHYWTINSLMQSINVSTTEQSYATWEECTNKVYPFVMRTTAGLLDYAYVKFGIVTNPPPVISSLSQSPPILCPGSYSDVTCNLSQGGVISYQWIPVNMPSNFTVTPIGDGKTVRVTKTSSLYAGGDPDNPPVPVFNLICVASNQYGTDRDTIVVNHATTCSGGGCPWIYVYNSDSSGLVQDNNILHRSEFSDNIGANINDFYKLQVQPSFVDNNCLIVIHETENDTDYYNSVKLYAVDHPIGTIVGVTENNVIVMYDNNTVTSTDSANLNSYRDITGIIQYYYQGNKIVNGIVGDNIYAHYDSSSQMKMLQDYKIKFGNYLSGSSSDSIALIGEVGENDRIIHGNVAKDYAGQINIFAGVNSYTKMFARRENNSTIIVPVSQTTDAIDHIVVNWNRDYQVSYFSIVPIMYSGFDVTEMPLVEAMHSTNGDCIVDLLIQDSVFVKLDSSSSLNLKFEDIQGPPTNMIRDYVIYVEGRYTNIITQGQNKALNINNNILINQNPLEYKLYVNYPNPFNPKTLIKYDVAKNGFVKIVIYDLLGRVVKELVNNFKSAGTYDVEFDGTNLASGVYVYRMESGNYVQARKMVLAK